MTKGYATDDVSQSCCRGIMRHTITRRDDPRPGFSVSTLARDYPRGSQVALHAHASDQLIYASCGVMQVSSGARLWVIPPHFGLWIPARVRHQIRMPESVSMRTLYLRPGITALAHARPLLRELIFEIVRGGRLRDGDRLGRALRDLLVAELERERPVPTELSLPADPLALRVAQTVTEHLGAPSSLQSICAGSGSASERSNGPSASRSAAISKPPDIGRAPCRF